MIKFGRKYRLTVETNDGGSAIIIEPPLTCQFTLTRSTMATLNTAEISIYGLGVKTRPRIFRDAYNPLINPQRIVLEAGYGQLTTVFAGNVWEANSTRQGVNIITNISSRDGGFDTTLTTTYRTMKAGSSVYEVVQSLVNDFKQGGGTLQLGKLSPTLKDTIFKRPVVLNGNTFDLIQKYTNNQAYVDLEKVYVLKDGEVVPGDIPIISESTGLLGTPKRDKTVLIVTTVFEPRIVMGQQVQLISTVLPIYNGTYKVIGVQHQGIISEAVNGQLQSTFTLYTGTKVFGEVN